MWVLGLLWTGLGLAAVVGTESEGLEGAAFTIVMLLILLVPVCLIIFSLRTRHKPDDTNH